MESLRERGPACRAKILSPQEILACARDEEKRFTSSILLQKFGYVAMHHENRSLDGHFLLRDKGTFFHIHCGKMTFMFIKNQELGHCTNFEPILLSNGSKAFYDPIEHNITSLSTTVPCHGKHHQLSEIF